MPDRIAEIRARLGADAPCDICALDDAYADIAWLLDEVERLLSGEQPVGVVVEG